MKYNTLLIANVKVIAIGASDLTGLEYFYALEELYCDGGVEQIDLSNNTALIFLGLDTHSGIGLTELDLSNNVNLTDIQILEDNIAVLDVTNNTKLRSIAVDRNITVTGAPSGLIIRYGDPDR